MGKDNKEFSLVDSYGEGNLAIDALSTITTEEFDAAPDALKAAFIEYAGCIGLGKKIESASTHLLNAATRVANADSVQAKALVQSVDQLSSALGKIAEAQTSAPGEPDSKPGHDLG